MAFLAKSSDLVGNLNLGVQVHKGEPLVRAQVQAAAAVGEAFLALVATMCAACLGHCRFALGPSKVSKNLLTNVQLMCNGFP